jgi:hypothetical protein
MSDKKTCPNCKSKFTNEINQMFHIEFCQFNNTVDVFKSDKFISSINHFYQTVNQYNTSNLHPENPETFSQLKYHLIFIANTLIYKNIDNIQLVPNTNMLFKILNQIYNSNNEDHLKEFFQIFINFCEFELEFDNQANRQVFYDVFNKYTTTNCSNKKIFVKLCLFKLFMENNTWLIENSPTDKLKLIIHIYDLLIADNSIEPDDMDDIFTTQLQKILHKLTDDYQENTV